LRQAVGVALISVNKLETSNNTTTDIDIKFLVN